MAESTNTDTPGFLDAHQRRTLEAAMARIIPTDDTPGAREAGTINFLDRYLSAVDYVYAKPDGSGFETLSGKRADAWRHRIDILRQKYVAGVEELDRRSQEQYGVDFAAAAEDEQDQILAALERPEREAEAHLEASQATAGFAPVEPAMQQTSVEIDLDFFPMLALHTRQGFYADPIYGGNWGQMGWELIGFYGPTSLAESHAGRYTSLPYFADEPIDWETHHGD